MDYNINSTTEEIKQIKKIIKKDFLEKFPNGNFEKNWENSEKIQLFRASDNIYEDTKDSELFNSEVHFILRLKAQYYVNQALKALKFDTINDENLLEDENDGNIGTPGRIAKLWAGKDLNSDSLSELADGRWTKKPRIAAFPIERIIIKGKFILREENKEIIFKDEKGIEYELYKEPIGNRFEPGLREIGRNVTYLVDIDNKDYNILNLLKNNNSEFDSEKILKQEQITLAIIDNNKRQIVKKDILNVGVGSTCSHHFLPYFVIGKENNSKITIAYKAYKENIGISKITKLVKWCAKRPTLQEGLTEHINREIQKVVKTEDVFVGLYGLMHTCEITRGSQSETSTTTEHGTGIFRDNEVLRKSIHDKS